MAGCSGSANKAGDRRHFADGDFADHGDRSFSGALERAGTDSGDLFGASGCATGSAFAGMGGPGGMLMGSCEYNDDFRHSRCWVEHRISVMELEQPAGNFMGIYLFQRVAAGGLAAMGRSGKETRCTGVKFGFGAVSSGSMPMR